MATSPHPVARLLDRVATGCGISAQGDRNHILNAVADTGAHRQPIRSADKALKHRLVGMNGWQVSGISIGRFNDRFVGDGGQASFELAVCEEPRLALVSSCGTRG